MLGEAGDVYPLPCVGSRTQPSVGGSLLGCSMGKPYKTRLDWNVGLIILRGPPFSSCPGLNTPNIPLCTQAESLPFLRVT